VGPGHYQIAISKKKVSGPVVQWKPPHEISSKV